MDFSKETAVAFTPWHGAAAPTEAAILSLLEAEGLNAYRWSNSPGDRYSAHKHTYDKVIYVVSGSITFGLPNAGDSIVMYAGDSKVMYAGDRLDLPAGVTHGATVGRAGVTCLEAHR
ncbi:MAG: cupin [Chloroflexota bacterium]